MDKRIVIKLATGQYKIIGQMQIQAGDQYPPRYDNVNLGDHVGSVVHAGTFPRHILYREYVDPKTGILNEFHPSQV